MSAEMALGMKYRIKKIKLDLLPQTYLKIQTIVAAKKACLSIMTTSDH